MAEIFAALIPSLVAVVTAGGALLVSWLNKKRTENEVKTIKEAIDASDGSFYVRCPSCGARVYLRGASIHKDEEEGGAK